MASGCSANNGETLIFTCAGASHGGQVANRAGVQLSEEGAGEFFCLAAVAGCVEAKMRRVVRAARRVVIDGCENNCVRRTLELAELPVDVYVHLDDLGIEKQPARPDMTADVRKVVERVKELLATTPGLSGPSGKKP